MDREQFIEEFHKASEQFFPIWADGITTRCVERLDRLYPDFPHGHFNCTSAMEELAELISAISQRMRGRPDDNYDVLQEIADVYVSIACISKVFGITEEDINRAIDVKLKKEAYKQQAETDKASVGLEKMSKFISLILRHKPETIGISLDRHGWADVNELLSGINATGRRIDLQMLEQIVREDDKQRYSFNGSRTKIRANQGHSVQVDVEMQEQEPPEFLYHGTAEKSLDKILKDGLEPMGRLYVHLSKDVETALKVGSRHGKPVVLKIHAGSMHTDWFKFYLSENKVWLTKEVPPEYIEREE